MNNKIINLSTNEIKVFDTFDIECSFILTSTTDKCSKEIFYNGSLECKISKSINIYISELHVSYYFNK